ncbi:MAG: hypothetical protein ACREAC_32590 [Blastocatellia bacterium]
MQLNQLPGGVGSDAAISSVANAMWCGGGDQMGKSVPDDSPSQQPEEEGGGPDMPRSPEENPGSKPKTKGGGDEMGKEVS